MEREKEREKEIKLGCLISRDQLRLRLRLLGVNLKQDSLLQ
jgi:hypothetical protein